MWSKGLTHRTASPQRDGEVTEGHKGQDRARGAAVPWPKPGEAESSARNSATSSSMLPTRPMAPQGQAPGLAVPREETGGRGWSQTAHSSLFLPPALLLDWESRARLPVQGLFPLRGEEPPGAPLGAQADKAAGRRVGAKTRK